MQKRLAAAIPDTALDGLKDRLDKLLSKVCTLRRRRICACVVACARACLCACVRWCCVCVCLCLCVLAFLRVSGFACVGGCGISARA